MFTAALIIIANTWKQPKGSLTDEWIKKLWYIYRIEYYSAMMNEIWPFEATWMDLEMIVLSEVSQRKTHIIDITYMWNLKNSTNELIYRTERDS